MSERAHNSLLRILDRIMEPQCRLCSHDLSIHYEGRCLGANYDHTPYWCACKRKEK